MKTKSSQIMDVTLFMKRLWLLKFSSHEYLQAFAVMSDEMECKGLAYEFQSFIGISSFLFNSWFVLFNLPTLKGWRNPSNFSPLSWSRVLAFVSASFGFFWILILQVAFKSHCENYQFCLTLVGKWCMQHTYTVFYYICVNWSEWTNYS